MLLWLISSGTLRSAEMGTAWRFEQLLTLPQAGLLKIMKLNVDQNPITAGEYRVQSIPTMMLFKDARVGETVIGAMPKSELLRRFSAHLG